jgi:hypothetical protein
MPAAKDKKRSSALREVWARLRRYFAPLMSDTPDEKKLWQRVEERVNEKFAEEDGREKPSQ